MMAFVYFTHFLILESVGVEFDLWGLKHVKRHHRIRLGCKITILSALYFRIGLRNNKLVQKQHDFPYLNCFFFISGAYLTRDDAAYPVKFFSTSHMNKEKEKERAKKQKNNPHAKIPNG